ncbi:MAG: SAM-dependent methyltransferase [archaeon GW2011_AR10]|uniref:Class I SAM-dependent methyltransferase n=1 Tax=Candidatus Iainarchaeum sp. TaxID=3101447 RepID=A0A7J4J184_9ARCH|nr:MAG: SAM-dependent methyltransferase [archaeon GW2011_AR10]HIH08976.1 class I SAM-dependent methyltransferase [Candidatus Diapherotrites archaeon]
MHKDEKLWDKVYDEFRGERSSVWRETATPFFTQKAEYLRHLGLRKILDAGCGDGRNILAFAKYGFNATGTDISGLALKKAEELCRNYPNAEFKKEPLEKPSFKRESFDVIVCDFVTAHLKEIELITNNFHKLLKKNGYLLIEFTSYKDPHCGKGKKIGEREFLQKGFYLRFYTINQIEKIMGKFRILCIDSISYTDPGHGTGYNRKKRHQHHSYFVFAQKN